MEHLRSIFRVRDSKCKAAAISEQILKPGSLGNFPSIVSISFAWRSDDNKSFIFFIANEENKESERLYAFSVRRRGIQNTLTLYAGLDPDSSPPLAFGGTDKILKSSSIITLPNPSYTGSTEPSTANCFERLDHKGSLKKLTELFHFRVEVGESRVAESFEWRGGSVHDRRHVSERRLIRLDSTTTDEGVEELVGIWNDETPSPTRGNKLGTFEFLGSGTKQDLGPYWKLMAIMTLLRILQINSAGPEALASMHSVSGGIALAPGVI